MSDHIEMEKRYGFRKMMLESCCNMLEREVVQLSVKTAHNQRHLIEYMKYTEFQKDRADRISQAWVDADIRRVKEFKEMHKFLPHESCKRLRKDSFWVRPTKLNLKECHPRTTLRP